ncbi:hypothetical protein F4810DRAFT_675595 [Camillea tinctor]|nr:hypothetical protein F4810DRAFT_675595 [Camillea tinctor]
MMETSYLDLKPTLSDQSYQGNRGSLSKSSHFPYQPDIYQPDTHLRQVSTRLSRELQSISDSVAQLKESIPSEKEATSGIWKFADIIHQEMQDATSRVKNIRLVDTTKEPGTTYSRLTSEIKDLQNILGMINSLISHSIDPCPHTKKALHFLKPKRFKVKKKRPVSLIALQAKVQVACISQDVFLALMNIIEALEKRCSIEKERHLNEAQDLQERLQRIHATKIYSHLSFNRLGNVTKAQGQVRPTAVPPQMGQELGNRILNVIPSILDRQYNPYRDYSINDYNVRRHRYFQGNRLEGTCSWLLDSEDFEQWLNAPRGQGKTIWCWGVPGTGKSTLASCVVDKLANIDRVHAYYYLGPYNGHLVERLVLSLLQQLCDLGHELKSDDLATYLPEFGLFPSSGETRNSAETKHRDTKDTEAQLIENTQGTLTRDYDASAGDPPSIIRPSSIIEPQVNITIVESHEALNCEETTVPNEVNQSQNMVDIIQFSSGTVGNVQALEKKSQATFSPSLAALIACLCQVISRIETHIFIVIDGWDERNQKPSDIGDFYNVIRKLQSFNCRLFLTARNEPSPKSVYIHTPLPMSWSSNHGDVASFVHTRLDDFFKATSIFDIQDNTFDGLPKIIATKCQGMFSTAILWVNLLLNSIQSSVFPKGHRVREFDLSDEFRVNLRPLLLDIRMEGQTFTPSLLARSNFQALERDEPVIAIPSKIILVWLATTGAPLSVADLSIVVPEICSRCPGYSYQLSSSLKSEAWETILDRLSGLVVIDPGTLLIRLVSEEVSNEVKTFWLDSPKTSSSGLAPSSSGILAEIAVYCMRYLLEIEVQDEDLQFEKQVVRLLQNKSFLVHIILGCRHYYRMPQAFVSSAQEVSALSSQEDQLGGLNELSKGGSRSITNDYQKEKEIDVPNIETEHKFSCFSDSAMQSLRYTLKEAEMSTLALQLIKDEKKWRLMALLEVYLRNGSSKSLLDWTKLRAWVQSMSMLHIAALLGLADWADFIIKQDPSLVSDTDTYGNTPLYEAVNGGFEDVVKILLVSGARVLTNDDFEQTPLNCAMRNGQVSIFVLLCETILNEEIKFSVEPDIEENIAQYYATCIAGNQGIPRDKLGRALIHSIKKRSLRATEFLLKNKADPNYMDNGKIPALHCAIQSRARLNDIEMDDLDPYVRLLLMHEADPQIKSLDKRGEPALHAAVRSGHPPTVNMLLWLGADPCCHDAQGRPVAFAILEGQVASHEREYLLIMRYLFVDILNQSDDYGRRAIHLAARDGPIEALNLLIRMGANPRLKDRDGKSPRTYATESGNKETIQALDGF